MTHYEYTTKLKPGIPCAASHMTFGGRCLNCGYDPTEVSSLPVTNKINCGAPTKKENEPWQSGEYRNGVWFPE